MLLTVAEILMYYDGAEGLTPTGEQILECWDGLCQPYVAVRVDAVAFLAVPVCRDLLQDFKQAGCDLTELLERRDTARWYLVPAGLAPDGTLAVVAQEGTLADSGLLPERGFYLGEIECPLPTWPRQVYAAA